MRPALTDYRHLASGKVRELYRVDDDHLLFVATDRISAFDHILDTPIPDKGRILTAMSVFYFGLLDTPNHLAGPPDDPRSLADALQVLLADAPRARAMGAAGRMRAERLFNLSTNTARLAEYFAAVPASNLSRGAA